jgi:hypothetical protein
VEAQLEPSIVLFIFFAAQFFPFLKLKPDNVFYTTLYSFSIAKSKKANYNPCFRGYSRKEKSLYFC